MTAVGWEHNLTVDAKGDRSDTLVLTCGVFADNHAVKVSMEDLNETLHLLRFNRVEYHWADRRTSSTHITSSIRPQTGMLFKSHIDSSRAFLRQSRNARARGRFQRVVRQKAATR